MTLFSTPKLPPIESRDSYGCTPLHIAAYENKLESVKYLVERGANVNARDDYMKTPLHEATRKCNIEMIKFLIEHGSDPGAIDNSGTTPLHRAMYCPEKDQKMLIDLLIGVSL